MGEGAKAPQITWLQEWLKKGQITPPQFITSLEAGRGIAGGQQFHYRALSRDLQLSEALACRFLRVKFEDPFPTTAWKDTGLMPRIQKAICWQGTCGIWPCANRFIQHFRTSKLLTATRCRPRLRRSRASRASAQRTHEHIHHAGNASHPLYR